MGMTADVILSELKYLVDEEKRIVLPKFFKTGIGEYGEGDKFLGVVVPNIRSVATAHLDISGKDIAALLSSPWHEMRMCGLLIMVEHCKQTRKSSWVKLHSNEEGEQIRKQNIELYLEHTDRINNWEVNSSGPCKFVPLIVMILLFSSFFIIMSIFCKFRTALCRFTSS